MARLVGMMQAILERYHEEQVWSDKVSRLFPSRPAAPLRLSKGPAHAEHPRPAQYRFDPCLPTGLSRSHRSTSSSSFCPSSSSSRGDEDDWSKTSKKGQPSEENPERAHCWT